jgi:hypothetical protein
VEKKDYILLSKENMLPEPVMVNDFGQVDVPDPDNNSEGKVGVPDFVDATIRNETVEELLVSR